MYVPIFYSGIQDNGSNSSIVCLIRFTDFWQSEVSFFDQSLLRLEEDYTVLPTLCLLILTPNLQVSELL